MCSMRTVFLSRECIPWSSTQSRLLQKYYRDIFNFVACVLPFEHVYEWSLQMSHFVKVWHNKCDIMSHFVKVWHNKVTLCQSVTFANELVLGPIYKRADVFCPCVCASGVKVWHLKMKKTRSVSQHVNQARIPLICSSYSFFFSFQRHVASTSVREVFIIYILYGADFRTYSARHVILRVFVRCARCSPSMTMRYTYVCERESERERVAHALDVCVCVSVCKIYLHICMS